MGPPCNRRGAEETSAGDEEKVMKVIMIVKIMMKRMLCGLVMPQDGRLEVLHDDNEEDIEEEKGKMATKIVMTTLMLIVMLMMIVMMLMMLSNLIAVNVL